MEKNDLKRLKDKLDKCRNVELSNVNLDDVDEITDIKILGLLVGLGIIVDTSTSGIGDKQE